MNTISRLTVSIAVFGLTCTALTMATAATEPKVTVTSKAAQKASTSAPIRQPKFLIVILSKYGRINQTQNGQFQLVLNKKDITDVTSFSNRPFRIVRNLTDQALDVAWTKGADSFEKEPPNAALVINHKIQTVVMTKIQVSDKEIVFNIKADGPKPLYANSGETTAFIDWCIGQVCMPCTCGFPGCNDPNECDFEEEKKK